MEPHLQKADGMDVCLMRVRKILWLIIMAIYLALTVKLAVGIVLPALRPHGTDAASVAMHAEAYGPVRAALPSLMVSWLVGFIGCAWGLRHAWRRMEG